MSGFSHPTAGPYRVDPDTRPGMEWNRHIVVVADPDQRIAFMAHSDGREPERDEATARLIAASWELWQHLKLGLRRLEKMHEHCPSEFGPPEDSDEVVMIRKLIAKVEGASP